MIRIFDIKKIKNNHLNQILDIHGVTGVGIGYKKVAGIDTREIAIIITVIKKKPRMELKESEIIPITIEGIPTDVQEIGIIKPSFHVNYVVSTRQSRFGGYQAKHGTEGTLKIFLPTLWMHAKGQFEDLVREISFTILLERICLERAFQHVRLKNRCNSKPCKMMQVIHMMYKISGEWMVLAEE